jgi:hypothetical protein
MYTMQFNYEKWPNLFNEENLRGWLVMGIEDYSKPFTSDYIFKRVGYMV